MLEKYLVEHCAPTLAGIKSANLFNCRFNSREEVLQELTEINSKLNERGVCVEALLWKAKSVLIYVYRSSLLEKELQQEGVVDLLVQYGYSDCKVQNCLNYLKTRLLEYECFPHEIGIFLGYPLQDVIGFIKNGGKNCKCCGFWKVYCNEHETRKLFEKLQKCTRVYMRVFAEGRSITQMTVCA